MIRDTRVLFFIGLALLAYGYVCRMISIYFFWDSRTWGWIILVITLLKHLLTILRSRKRQQRKTIWVKAAIFFLAFSLVILPFAIIMVKSSDAYLTAKDYLKTDAKIKDELGKIRGFGFIPTGEVSTFNRSGAESGNATFNITVRGSKKYKDVLISLEKLPDNIDWVVTSVY